VQNYTNVVIYANQTVKRLAGSILSE